MCCCFGPGKFDPTHYPILVRHSEDNHTTYCPSFTHLAEKKVYEEGKRGYALLLLPAEVPDFFAHVGRSVISPLGNVLRGCVHVSSLNHLNPKQKLFRYLLMGGLGGIAAIVLTPAVIAIQIIIELGHAIRLLLATLVGLAAPQSSAFYALSNLKTAED